ncbi:MAG: hypothetical protein IJC82_06960, partial [Firmicutes bacterium]|nr:hypothetical protein [Bacillota bacterium]
MIRYRQLLSLFISLLLVFSLFPSGEINALTDEEAKELVLSSDVAYHIVTGGSLQTYFTAPENGTYEVSIVSTEFSFDAAHLDAFGNTVERANNKQSIYFSCNMAKGETHHFNINSDFSFSVVIYIRESKKSTSLALNSTTLSGTSGEKRLIYGIFDGTPQEIHWFSSDPSIVDFCATSEYSAELLFFSPGSATITAQTENGLIANCLVSVVNGPITAVKIEVSSGDMNLYKGTSETVWACFYPEGAEKVVWSVADESILSCVSLLNGRASITGKKEGLTT